MRSTPLAFCLLMLFALLPGCGAEPSGEGVTQVVPGAAGTLQPDAALTIQSEVAQTAAWVATHMTVPAPAVTPSLPSPVAETPVAGLSLAGRVGACPLPEGSTLHERLGFCIAAPADWVALNVDGGAAAALSTTPGQVLALEPDWADTPDVCELLIYIASDKDVADHLVGRYQAVSSRTDLAVIAPVETRSIGSLRMLGFTWALTDGTQGAVYAEQIGPTRIIHISHQGTACALPDLLPALDTLRLN